MRKTAIFKEVANKGVVLNGGIGNTIQVRTRGFAELRAVFVSKKLGKTLHGAIRTAEVMRDGIEDRLHGFERLLQRSRPLIHTAFEFIGVTAKFVSGILQGLLRAFTFQTLGDEVRNT